MLTYNISALFLNKFFGQCTDSDGCAVDRATAWCEMTDAIYYRSVDCICVYAENLLGCDRLCLLFFFADWVPSYPRRCCWMRWATQSWWAWCGRHRCTCMKRGKAFNAWQGSYWTETTRTKWRESVMHWQRPQDVTKSECWEACSVAQYDSLLIHLPLMESSDVWPTYLLYHASVKTENSSRPLHQSFLLLTQSWVADMGAPLLCISTSLPVLVQTRLGWRLWGAMTASLDHIRRLCLHVFLLLNTTPRSYTYWRLGCRLSPH